VCPSRAIIDDEKIKIQLSALILTAKIIWGEGAMARAAANE